jgi:hypothetical protein
MDNLMNKLKKIQWLRNLSRYAKSKYYLAKHRMNIKMNVTRFANYKKITELENIHHGNRCFVIGNGPSLTVNDLDSIKKEFSFACNRIYKVYNSTDWRPTYFCAQDEKVLEDITDNLDYVLHNSNKIFLRNTSNIKYPKDVVDNPNTILYTVEKDYFDISRVKFSRRVNWKVYEGHTVLYSAIQMAVYMGFSEIYLLGVDHNYSRTLDEDKNIITNENVKDYFDAIGDINGKWNLPNIYASTQGFISAKKYASENNIKIFNATRGGKLEVFERVKLEDII